MLAVVRLAVVQLFLLVVLFMEIGWLSYLGMGVAATSLSTAAQSMSCIARPQVGQENRPCRT